MKCITHFRITFGASPSTEIQRTSADHRISPTDNSMLMNALTMKYIPRDSNNAHSPKLVQNAVTHTVNTNIRSAPVTPTIGISNDRLTEFNGKNSNTDMSITSYRYMEKYGLL